MTEDKKQALIEVGALDTEVDNLYGWIIERVLEYGKHKNIDSIIERLSACVSDRAFRKKNKELNPYLKQLRDDFRNQMEDAAYLENQNMDLKKELNRYKKESNLSFEAMNDLQVDVTGGCILSNQVKKMITKIAQLKDKLEQCRKEIGFQQSKINIRDSHLRERSDTANKFEKKLNGVKDDVLIMKYLLDLITQFIQTKKWNRRDE